MATTDKQITNRQAHGQAIIEGTICTIMVFGFLILSLFFAVDLMVLATTKQKLALATQAATRQATELNKNWLGMERNVDRQELQSEVQAVFAAQLKQLGVTTPARVFVRRQQIRNNHYCLVTSIVDAHNLVKLPFWPRFAFTETACSVFANTTAPAVLGFTFASSNQSDAEGMGASMYLPAYGRGFNTKGPNVYIAGKMNYYGVGINQSVTTFRGPRQIVNPFVSDAAEKVKL